MMHSIVPPYLLARVARADEHGLHRAAQAAQRALLAAAPLHEERRQLAATTPAESALPSSKKADAVPRRTIFDAHDSEDLPGSVVRTEGQSATSDVTATEAYDGLGATFALYRDAFGRDSIDGKGLPLLATVHYGRDYDNAYWNGERMVFGDGDGEVFGRFTASVSVIGHELSHGVTQFTANLTYQGQSGALNESFSDVMGALVEQHQNNQTADQATWLIWAGLFTPAVHGTALRSMIAPGTAYDDDVLGKDPQPADMAHYHDTSDDNGGVHLNSGIPNRAFALAARAIGGFAWLTAGQVWYDTISGSLPADADFRTFATATVAAAAKRFGSASSETNAVRAAWVTVGVLTDGDAG